MTTDVAAPAFQMLSLTQLHESALNPRKTFDPVKLAELTASVKAKGVITPLLVRPNNKGFEIAAGHRRFRAAKAAELLDVPAVIRSMDDVTFLEILIMENDEREDLHPIEEAQGYKTLITKAGYSVERIAERKGCSEKYIYDRVKLLSLIPEAQQLFRANKFTAGHAILLARLKPEDQQRALELTPTHTALFEEEDLLWDPDAGSPRAGKSDPYAEVKARSVRELQAWIDENVRFDTATVDTMVFPETAAVVTRVEETEEKLVKITHDHYVRPEAKDEKERTYGPQSWKRADGQLKSKTCERAVTGVIVVGPGRGEAFKVCVDKKKCQVHWKAERRASTSGRGSTAAAKELERHEQQMARQRAEQERQEAARQRFTKARPEILKAIAEKVKKAPTGAKGPLGAILCDRKDKEAELVPSGKTADDLVRHLAFLDILREARPYYVDEFAKMVKPLGVDVKKIMAEAAPVEKPKADDKAKKK